jgi:hypothetical protein
MEPAYRLTTEKLDLIGGIRSRNLQLWAIYTKQEAVAGILTRLVREATSGELHCQIWLVGGSRLSEWIGDFLGKLKDWAKSEGCSAIVATGVRPGWERVAPRLGFTRSFVDGPDQYWEARI